MQAEMAPSPRIWKRDAVIALLVAVASLLLVAILFIIARDEPSAGSSGEVLGRPALTADSGCQNFGDYWQIESGLAIPSTVLVQFTNCRQASDSSWFVPVDAADPRLVETPVIPAEDAAAADVLRSTLRSQIGDLNTALSPGAREGLMTIYSQDINPVIGHLREGVAIGPVRKQYIDEAMTFLQDPANAELNAYVQWQRDRRGEGFDQFLALCQARKDLTYLHQGCRGMEDSMSVRFPPFPWELTDPLLLEEYLVGVTSAGDESS